MAGIIGAGGNFGAAIAGLLFREDALSISAAPSGLGVAVAACASLTLLVRFSPEKEASERQLLEDALTTS